MLPEHTGFMQKRTWHKIKWIKGKHEGRFDIFDDEDLEKYKNGVEVIETFKTDLCTTGVSMEFGKTSKEKIDEWIRENKC